jgi:hypothetical protein
MVKIIEPVGSGKTYKLMRLCHENRGIFVAADMREADIIRQVALAQFGYHLNTATYSQVLDRSPVVCRGHKSLSHKLYIDRLDDFLHYIGDVGAIAMDSPQDPEAGGLLSTLVKILSQVEVKCGEPVPRKSPSYGPNTICGEETYKGVFAICPKCEGKSEIVQLVTKYLKCNHG